MTLRLLMAIAFAGAAYGQSAASTPRADVRKLLEISGALNQADDSLSQQAMEARMREMLKPDNAPPDRRPMLERFVKEFSVAFAEEARKKKPELLDQVMALYEKYYSPDEVKALIAFYESPLGRKLATTAPKASMEIMRMSVEWGQTIGQRIGQEVGARIDAEEKAKKQ